MNRFEKYNDFKKKRHKNKYSQDNYTNIFSGIDQKNFSDFTIPNASSNKINPIEAQPDYYINNENNLLSKNFNNKNFPINKDYINIKEPESMTSRISKINDYSTSPNKSSTNLTTSFIKNKDSNNYKKLFINNASSSQTLPVFKDDAKNLNKSINNEKKNKSNSSGKKNHYKFPKNDINNTDKNFSNELMRNLLDNQEFDHIINSYDFVSENNETKIHFRNLLYLVKELNSEKKYLIKEIKIKDELINKLEKKLLLNSNNKKDEHFSSIEVNKERINAWNTYFDGKLQQQKIFYENIIEEYRNKLKALLDIHENNEKNMVNIKQKYNFANSKIENFKDELKQTTFIKSKLENLNGKYEKINLEQQKKIELLENNLRIIISIIKELYKNENLGYYPKVNKLLSNISRISGK